LKKIIYIFLVFILLLSCKKNEIKESIAYPNYYPNNIGKSLIYDVVEINIDADVNVFDTLRYELKEYFDSAYTDQAGNKNIRLKRSIKNKNDSVWHILNIWYVSITKNAIEKTENNYRYKRLLLPLQLNSKWDGNIYNTISEQIYEITKINEPMQIANTDFNKVCVVLQNDYEDLIEKYYSTEIYAENIGLVYRENINIKEMIPLPGSPYPERIKIGNIYTQTFKETSKN